ncbi:MAG: hypothetical protein AAFU79_13320 [Myxococcota bacterium]
MWTTRDERVAARALMAKASREERLRFLQEQTQLSAEKAEELLNHVQKTSDRKKAQIRQFVGLVSEDGPVLSTLIMQLGTAAFLVLFGGFMLSIDQVFLAVVCFVAAAANVVMALREHRRRTLAIEAAKAAKGSEGSEDA